MYANARTGRETPWHGRWDVSAEASKVITENGRKVKEHGSRMVYFDPDCVEDCEQLLHDDDADDGHVLMMRQKA